MEEELQATLLYKDNLKGFSDVNFYSQNWQQNTKVLVKIHIGATGINFVFWRASAGSRTECFGIGRDSKSSYLKTLQ